MDRLVTANLKLGIIAGGQLGKMLIQEASKWDIITYVMDKDVHCPASSIASCYVEGDHLDFDSVYQFGKTVDLLTFEIESVNVEALRKLKSEGHTIVPDPEILALVQDKGLQKTFFAQNGIPTAEFRTFDSKESILKSIEDGDTTYPFVQKIRKGGYDGRGVAVINDPDDLSDLLASACIVEDKVEILKEISVIAARNRKGDIECYPVVEMIIDPTANLVDTLICPSSITIEQSLKALNCAAEIIELLKLEGLLAVEMFVNGDGNVIVNEMAPRPHNSGHHTIESIITSQFEQHLRAVLDLPLGSTKLKLPSVMINILGSEGHNGPVMYEGLTEIMAIDGVKIHLYSKKITRPFRKMGHVTVLSSSLEGALQKAEQVKQLVKVKSWKNNW
jgi:5-(carboxyamino)imidazole ribonucleotide synthase